MNWPAAKVSWFFCCPIRISAFSTITRLFPAFTPNGCIAVSYRQAGEVGLPQPGRAWHIPAAVEYIMQRRNPGRPLGQGRASKGRPAGESMVRTQTEIRNSMGEYSRMEARRSGRSEFSRGGLSGGGRVPPGAAAWRL